MSKIDQVLEIVTELRIDSAKTNEHLKAINGTLGRHDKDIGTHYKMFGQQDKRIDKIDTKIAKYIGIATGIIGLLMWLGPKVASALFS